jgi:hypothetical protein
VRAPEPLLSSSAFLSSVEGRWSLGLGPPPPPSRNGVLGEALRSVALSGSCLDESSGWNTRPRSRRRRHGEAPGAGGEKWGERTGEGESCGERRCGCLMEGARRVKVSGSGPSWFSSFNPWWGVRLLQRGSDKRRERERKGKSGRRWRGKRARRGHVATYQRPAMWPTLSVSC